MRNKVFSETNTAGRVYETDDAQDTGNDLSFQKIPSKQTNVSWTRGRKFLIWAVVALVLLICAGIAGYYGSHHTRNAKETSGVTPSKMSTPSLVQHTEPRQTTSSPTEDNGTAISIHETTTANNETAAISFQETTATQFQTTPRPSQTTDLQTIKMETTHLSNKTTKPIQDKPENCSFICYDIISGIIPNQPVGLATAGSAARIYPGFAEDEGVEVYCDCSEGSDQAWTVFQRRMDGSVDFFNNWIEYAEGFGNKTGEFWLGLEVISSFTTEGGYELRVDIEDWSNDKVYAKYSTFSVADTSTNYTLTVDEYSGTAGDSFKEGNSSYHSGQQFSTRDRDNDETDIGFDGDCANYFVGAWWFKECFYSHLNGEYFQGGISPPGTLRGINWGPLRTRLKSTEMKFRKH